MPRRALSKVDLPALKRPTARPGRGNEPDPRRRINSAIVWHGRFPSGSAVSYPAERGQDFLLPARHGKVAQCAGVHFLERVSLRYWPLGFIVHPPSSQMPRVRRRGIRPDLRRNLGALIGESPATPRSSSWLLPRAPCSCPRSAPRASSAAPASPPRRWRHSPLAASPRRRPHTRAKSRGSPCPGRRAPLHDLWRSGVA